MSSRQLVMVIGQGRSGTSVITSVLGELGYTIPQPVITADEANPLGFGEPAWLVDFHKRLLRSALVQGSDARPSAWSDVAESCLALSNVEHAANWLRTQFEHSDFVVLKDPRLLWFSVLWEGAAEELGVEPAYVIPLRDPAVVVASKDRWYADQHSDSSRTAGWINTMLYTERATRDRSRGFVRLDDFLDDWVSAIAQLDRQVGMPPVGAAQTREYRNADTLVDPSLRRTVANWDDLDVAPHLADLADRVNATFARLATDEGQVTRLDDDFDGLRAEYRDLYQAAADIAQSTAIASSREALRTGRRRGRRAGIKEGRRQMRRRQARSTEQAAPSVSTIERWAVRMRSLPRRVVRRVRS